MATWSRPEVTRIATDANLDPAVKAEIEDFNRERERVRLALGKLGGKEGGAINRAANIAFITGLSVLLILHFALDLVGDMLSLELGLLLVSVKILWMMRSQERYQHFLFWMLHSIEFKQNEMLERLGPRPGSAASAPPRPSGEAAPLKEEVRG